MNTIKDIHALNSQLQCCMHKRSGELSFIQVMCNENYLHSNVVYEFILGRPVVKHSFDKTFYTLHIYVNHVLLLTHIHVILNVMNSAKVIIALSQLRVTIQ